MNYSGGFQGRTNKIVDGCYSYWVGGLFPIFDLILRKQGKEISGIKILLSKQFEIIPKKSYHFLFPPFA